MPIEIFREGKAEGFTGPASLPQTNEQAKEWLQRNQTWWQEHPNRYDFDFKGDLGLEEFSPDFFKEIDKRFFDSVWQFMPWDHLPFDNLIDYEGLKDKRVLEIGVGCGSNAQLLAQHAGEYTGIDLTDYAVKCTKERLRVFSLPGKILQMNAEQLLFEDNAFDLVWSWGVIHHTANTQNVLKEISRILVPGGNLAVMVYHYSPWNTYIRGALYYGILRGQFFKTRSVNKIIQDSTDGALARYYTREEWNNLLLQDFDTEEIAVYGSKSQLIPLPMGRLKETLMGIIPNRIGRFITNRPFFGFLLVSSSTKKS